MAKKTLPFTQANVIGTFEKLQVAEFPVRDTALVGKTLADAKLRRSFSITVIGIWEKGTIQQPTTNDKLERTNILIVAGSESAIKNAGALLTTSTTTPISDSTVLILGGGRVGQAAAKFLNSRDIPYIIIEKRKGAYKDDGFQVYGDAADINVLKKAGIDRASSVLITTHDDAMNIYLSFYCRQLRHDIQIISRATADRTTSKLHRAGADLVDSSAALGASSIMELLRSSDTSFFSEEMNVFSTPIPAGFAGISLAELKVREKTKCSLLAIKDESSFLTNPGPATIFKKKGTLILAGSLEAEKLFRQEFIE